MYRRLSLIIMACLIIVPTQVNAQWNDQKGRGQRANSDVEKEPQAPIRKSIHDYAEEYGYGTPESRGKSSANTMGGLQDLPRGTLSANDYARNLHNSCSGHWSKSNCLKSTAYLSRELSNDYYKKLTEAGKTDELVILRGMCDPVAEAINQAVNEHTHRQEMQKCVNTIADLSAMTRVNPDNGMYKLASWSVICMANGSKCTQLEKNLALLGR